MREKSTKRVPTIIRKTVWEQLAILKGHPPDIWRKDKNGKAINWQEYESSSSEYSWTIIYKTALEDGGLDEPSNMEVVRK